MSPLTAISGSALATCLLPVSSSCVGTPTATEDASVKVWYPCYLHEELV